MTRFWDGQMDGRSDCTPRPASPLATQVKTTIKKYKQFRSKTNELCLLNLHTVHKSCQKKPNHFVQETKCTVQEAYLPFKKRTIQEKNHTVQETKRTMYEAYQSVRETNRTMQETYLTVLWRWCSSTV
mgnify:CR=1 FL=1